MEIRDFALRIVTTPDLAVKLAPPPELLSDATPRLDAVPDAPARPENLQIVPVGKAKVPPLVGMHICEQRVRILHGMANHELQAVELAARALLLFPDAPAGFRQGLVRLIADEQRHTQMYIDRLREMGTAFGDFPVSGYFWNKLKNLDTPIRFICAMNLTFENANLDHALNYAAVARDAGDEATAALLDQIFADEINHVKFGLTWLAHFKKPEQSMWDAWTENLDWPLRPAKARAEPFHDEGRILAGMDAEFIAKLKAASLDDTLAP